LLSELSLCSLSSSTFSSSSKIALSYNFWAALWDFFFLSFRELIYTDASVIAEALLLVEKDGDLPPDRI
jgi:hypothetical protein